MLIVLIMPLASSYIVGPNVNFHFGKIKKSYNVYNNYNNNSNERTGTCSSTAYMRPPVGAAKQLINSLFRGLPVFAFSPLTIKH
jgi:hypothetical protein